MSSACKQLTGGLVFLAISLFYGWEAGNISLFFTREGQIFNARTVPYALSLIGIVFSLFLTISGVAGLVRRPQGSEGADMGGGEGDGGESGRRAGAAGLNWRPVVLLTVLMAAYAALFSFLGFTVATAGFLIGAFAVLGARGWRSLLAVPVGTVMVFWLLVAVVMNIHLAEGTLWNIFR